MPVKRNQIVSPGSPVAPFIVNEQEMKDQVRISRVTFEGLAARAGVSVKWQNGEPYLSENNNSLTDPGLTPREREVEKRCRQLEAENMKLRAEIQSVIKRDDNAKDIIERMVRDAAKARADTEEEKAKQDLRKRGASEADIAALEGLFGKTGVELHDTIAPPRMDITYKSPIPKGEFVRRSAVSATYLTGKAPSVVSARVNSIEDTIRAKLISIQYGYDMTGIDKPNSVITL